MSEVMLVPSLPDSSLISAVMFGRRTWFPPAAAGGCGGRSECGVRVLDGGPPWGLIALTVQRERAEVSRAALMRKAEESFIWQKLGGTWMQQPAGSGLRARVGRVGTNGHRRIALHDPIMQFWTLAMLLRCGRMPYRDSTDLRPDLESVRGMDCGGLGDVATTISATSEVRKVWRKMSAWVPQRCSEGAG